MKSVSIIEIPYRNQKLVGILHSPELFEGEKKGILFLNGAHKAKYGPGRLYIWLARKLCDAGYYVFRYDPPGFGDSCGDIAAEPTTINRIFDRIERGYFVPSAKTAVRYLKSDVGITKLTAFGLCGGGLNAIKLAAGMTQIDAAIIFNLAPFFSNFGIKTNAPSKRFTDDKKKRLLNESKDSISNYMSYVKKLGNIDAWINLIHGKSDIKLIFATYLTYFMSRLSRVTFGTNYHYVIAATKMEQDMRPYVLIYSGNDQHKLNYEKLSATDYAKLKPELHVIENANHIVSDSIHREELLVYILDVTNNL